jgi:hypothetical protein
LKKGWIPFTLFNRIVQTYQSVKESDLFWHEVNSHGFNATIGLSTESVEYLRGSML